MKHLGRLPRRPKQSCLRDSARVRFIREVETGKHPRLPRCQLLSERSDSLHRPFPRIGALRLRRCHPARSDQGDGRDPSKSGSWSREAATPELDQAALTAAYRSALVVGGEIGSGDPLLDRTLTYPFPQGHGDGWTQSRLSRRCGGSGSSRRRRTSLLSKPRVLFPLDPGRSRGVRSQDRQAG